MIQSTLGLNNMMNMTMLWCVSCTRHYDLKQVPQAWFERLKSFLIHSLSFTKSIVDDCLLLKSTSKGGVVLLIYVDDIVITGSDAAEVENIIQIVNMEF